MRSRSVATSSITLDETPEVTALLRRADDALILGHRTSEWTGRAPTLEEELALANIALDLIGEARLLYAEAGAVTGHTEDQLAYLRDAHQWRNALIMELPNGDFAFTTARLFLVSALYDLFWRTSMQSENPGVAAIAAKAEKESAYHLRHSAEWLVRLGDGTDESHRRTQDAVDALWPYTGELFEPEQSVFADPASLREAWSARVNATFARATLTRTHDGWMQTGGRIGRHTEHLGYLLAEMQFLQRTYPGAAW